MKDAAEKPSRAIALLRRRPLLVLFFFCFVVWLPGLFTLPPLDRDESRFAQASKQMLETGNFVDIRFDAQPRYKKPIGIYWLQAASAEVFGAVTGDPEHKAIWIYRVPSLLGAFAAVAFLYWCMAGFAGAEAGFLAALLLGLTLLLSSEAKIAKTDAVLLASVMATQAVLMRVYLAARDPARAPPSRLLILGGWAAFAAGILIKGPVIVGVLAATVIALLVWDRWKPVDAQADWWRWLGRTRPVSGVVLVLVLVLPWFILIGIQSHGLFYQLSLGHDFAAKLAGGQETHGAPPGYYLLLTTLTFWPATLFLLPAIGAAWTRRAEPAIRFLMAWAGGWWLICEIVPTKLPHYILPAYPALAMLAALWVLAPRETDMPLWRRVLFYLAPVQFLLAVAAFTALPIVVPNLYGTGTTGLLIAAAALFALLGIAAAILLLRGANQKALACAMGSVLILYPVLTRGVAPRLEQLWVSPRLAALVTKDSRPGDPPPVLAGYEEPSLVFLLGTHTRLANGYGAAQSGADQGGLALVADSQRPAFMARLAELEADATPVDQLSGFDYSRGKRVHITVYRVTQLHRSAAMPQE
jgi:4-amino-4-deoxy-L-arabinose transferase-like glycosyltransferase